MSLLLKKLNQASEQKAADENAEKAAAQDGAQSQGAQPQQPATATPATPPPVAPPTPATPPVAPAPATTAAQQPAQPPQQPAQPAAAPTLSTPPTAAVAKQTTPPPAAPATPPAPAQSAPGSVGLKTRAQPATPPPAPVAAKPAPAAPAAPGAPGSIGLKTAAPTPTPAPAIKPAPAAAGVQPATTPPPAPVAPAAATAAPPPQPSATGVQLATAAMVDAPKPQAGRKLRGGLRVADYFSKARGVASASRVLGAQSSDKGSRWQKFAVGAAVAVVVIGGGLYASSLLGLLGGGIGGEDVAQGTTTEQTTTAQQGAVVETLPAPAVDVQAQIALIDAPEVEEIIVDLTVSGEEAIADYEIVPEVQYTEEEWSLIEREEREFAEEEERKIAVIAATDPVGVDTELGLAIQLESQRDAINLRDDKISVRADDAVKVEGRAEIKSSDKAQRRADKLLQAANFYAAGRYDRAGRVYGEVLDESPANLQALRGSALAAAAMRRYKAAADFHVRILELFPDDPFAVAELSNLGGINPAAVERLLKKLIGKTPAIDGRLYFALGNVYASSSRWHRARDAFGEALSREKNPDYAYNLAIAMEYLREPGLAAHYYRQALQMAKGSVAAGFDADKVRARIAVLDA